MNDDRQTSEACRVTVAGSARDLALLNLEHGTSGNLSVRFGDRVVITATGASFAESSDPEHLALVNAYDATHLSGPAPSSDLQCHLSIYDARSDIDAIIHTHSHYVTVASVLGEPIPAISTMQADYFGGEIPVVAYANHRKGTFGDAQCFAQGQAFLLEKHGGLILIRRADLASAARRLVAMEEIARLYYEVRLVKQQSEIDSIPKEDVDLLFAYFSAEYGQS